MGKITLSIMAMSYPILASLSSHLNIGIDLLSAKYLILYQATFVAIYLISEKPNFKSIIAFKLWHGFLIFMVTTGTLNSIDYFFDLGSNQSAMIDLSYSIDFFTLFLILLMSPLFEELFLIKVLFSSNHSVEIMLLVSLLLRFLIHFYQGQYGLISNGIIGLIFILYYIKKKQLMPLVIAHSLINTSVLYVNYYE